MIGEPGSSPRRRVTLAYDGTGYSGWQVQPGRVTIQGEVERALERVARRPVRVAASGRTDAGVHALGQVVHFDDPTDLPPERLLARLNAQLPETIRARDLAVVPAGFHARYDAVEKTYFYQLHFVPGAVRKRELQAGLPPHRRRTFEPVPGDLDLAAMRRAARQLVGTRDFTALSRAMEPARGVQRTLSSIRIQRIPDGARVFATADGFLYGMVRMLAGLLVEIGTGRRDGADVPALLSAADRSRAPPSLPARGLFLWRVRYAGEIARCGAGAAILSSQILTADTQGNHG